MEQGIPGRTVATGLHAVAFLPDPLPPKLSLSHTIVGQFGAAASRLGGVRALSLSPLFGSFQHLLIGPLLRREATASSRIEGTRTDLEHLLLYEATGERSDPGGDAREVLNYVQALAYGLNRRAERPVTMQLVREMHALLMTGTRGADKSPGEFRRIQNWIGGMGGIHQARYVPPPPEHVLPLMENLIGFVNDSSETLPDLVRIAIAQYQFEAIHPFEDGSGRLGRLLIVLLLAEWGVLPGPNLSISEGIEERREEYIDHLKAVSTHGDWEGWVLFFLSVVEEQADREQRRIVGYMQLRERLRQRYQGGRSGAILHLLDFILERPVFSAMQAQDRLNYTYQSILTAIDRLRTDGVLREVTGQRRNRVFVADDVLAIVASSTTDSAGEDHAR